MYSSLRAERVVKAFINCVKQGAYTYDYAVLLIEDNAKYGYLTDNDKNEFYAAFENAEETENTEE